MTSPVQVQFESRRSAVLSGSDLPCLAEVATINVTRGCAHGCVYCYAQGYSTYPGQGRVVVYDNLAAKIADEFRRKRKKPARAYFSPSCDAFQPLDAVLDATHNAMRALLERGVAVAFLTKGAVPERFLNLFARHPGQVSAQIGLTTLNAKIAATLEPGAAASDARIDNIRRLAARGLSVSLRIDPLFPLLTDTDDGLSALFAAAASAGATQAATSYVFMRRSMAEAVFSALRAYGAAAGRLRELLDRGAELSLHESRHRVLALSADFRRANAGRIARLAAAHGLRLRLCGCKNHDITRETCLIAGEAPRAGMLF
jgi:DNA repair photolyase